MKKVLIIAYYFPPIGGGGVTRPLKFFNYLPDFKWSPYVLTVKSKNFWVMDYAREKQISNNKNVCRTFSLTAFDLMKIFSVNSRLKSRVSDARETRKTNKYRKISDFFLIPDSYIGWFPFALYSGIKLLRKHKFNLIFATSPPPTTLLVGLSLSKLFNIPLVADFRDLWVNEYFYKPPTGLHHYLHSYLENKVIKQASLVTCRSENMKAYMSKKYKNKVNPEKFKTVSNGFDLKDTFIKPTKKNNHNNNIPIKVVHTGSLTITRSIDSLAEAVSQLIREKKIMEKDIEIKLIGRRDDINDKLIEKYNLSNVVTLKDSVSHQEALDIQQNADVLLLIGNKVQRDLADMILPGKIFEYLAMNKPIFAIVPNNSESLRIIEKARAGISADIHNIADIKEKFLFLITRLKNGDFSFESDKKYIMNFEYKKLTSKLAGLFDTVLKK